MIISASRRTDIPAFYAEWFINRIRAGYCTVPNPFNKNQVASISLRPEDVDVIVFWTRNPHPLFPYLDELNGRGYRYYFQYTVLNYPRSIDTKGPALAASLRHFRNLADRIGPDRVVWRYDPIVLSALTDEQFHTRTYRRIAEALRGCTFRSVISLVDLYPKLRQRLRDLAHRGVPIREAPGQPGDRFDALMSTLAKTAQDNGMTIVSCAETVDLTPYGILPGKCIDDALIERLFYLEISHQKDSSQRKACGCVVSRDIGMYETCMFGCQYCYATGSFERAHMNRRMHDPHSPSLVGWYEAEPNVASCRTGGMG